MIPVAREIYDRVSDGKWFGNESIRKRYGDRAEMSWFGLRNGWRQPPPVSFEDRIVVGIIDRGLNNTNHMLEVGGSRNR